MLLASAEDPARIIVEQSSVGWFSAWGPLIGVVVGAILGALGQVVASNLSHHRDLERERREWRRVAYLDTMSAVEEYINAIQYARALLSIPAGSASRATPAAESADMTLKAVQRITAAQIRVSLCAPQRAQQAVDGLVKALRAVDTKVQYDGWDDVVLWHGRALAEMRKDLGVSGPVSLLPEAVTSPANDSRGS